MVLIVVSKTEKASTLSEDVSRRSGLSMVAVDFSAVIHLSLLPHRTSRSDIIAFTQIFQTSTEYTCIRSLIFFKEG